MSTPASATEEPYSDEDEALAESIVAQAMEKYLGVILGAARNGGATSAYELPAHHLVTHAVVLGMTGSGKTGLLTVLVEEALRHQVSVLMIDVKGDLPNLRLTLPGEDYCSCTGSGSAWCCRSSASALGSVTLGLANDERVRDGPAEAAAC